MIDPTAEPGTGPTDAGAAAEFRSEANMVGLLQAGGELIGVRAKTLLEVTLIKGLDSILSSDPAVVGAFSLRGTLIPVLDPFVLCGLPSRDMDRSSAAVLTDGASMIALGVEGISRLRRLGAESVQTQHGQDTPLIGHAMLDARMVHLIDTDRIFADHRLPRADTASAASPRARPRTWQNSSRSRPAGCCTVCLLKAFSAPCRDRKSPNNGCRTGF